MEYLLANSTTDYTAAANLFKEYAAAIGINLGFQHFDNELASIQQMYAPPRGCLILCRANNQYIGCIGLRPISPAIGELKRMYVRPAYTGYGIGQNLLTQAIVQAKILGYAALRLDTLTSMQPAVHLYQKNGFYNIGAYYPNPLPDVLYFEKIL
jgi:ribosomal protein S18 acetylase RimI-like enzyme